jgi:L-ascorbate metabolism protein UlaG (beta-lactamase superfamily)
MFVALLFVASFPSTGNVPSGERLLRVERSPWWHNGKFTNPQPQWLNSVEAWRDFLTGGKISGALPDTPVPVMTADAGILAREPASGLRVTWFGHSSVLVQIEGKNILIDPLWGPRLSPLSFIGPVPWYAPGISIHQLPSVDAVLISHDHYDHLDYTTVMAFKSGTTRFIVPVGVGVHLESWGIPPERISELDWWEDTLLGDIRITATPARHKSGRFPGQADKTLWSGFAITGPTRRIWYSGDTGFHQALKTTGERLGPFDVTLIDAGQYDANWPDTHLGPELAVEAHRLVRGNKMIPVHWGLVQEARHVWTEPAERVLAAARCQGVNVLIPRPGESIEPLTAPPTERWWPRQDWLSAEERPVLATVNGKPEQRVPAPLCSQD